MPRVISQDTFDQIVSENTDDLDMTPEEAVKEAVQQFEAQGVDLSNIITEPNMSKIAREELLACLARLGACISQEENGECVEEDLSIVRKWCNKGVAFRILAGSVKTYDTLIDVLHSMYGKVNVRILILRTLTSLMAGYPDLLDQRGIEIMTKCLQTSNLKNDALAVVAALKWTQECCKKHEKNRQDFMTKGLHGEVANLLHQAENDPSVVIEVCELIKLLTLDDDIREHVSRAHEHARVLAVRNLCILTELLENNKNDVNTLPYILGALSALIVRNEFCEKVDKAGGITHIFDILATYPDVEKINIKCLRLIKLLAGNDDVKAHFMEAGAAPLLLSAMVRHKSSSLVSHAGCGCIAALALRSPENSQILVENGAADALVDALKLHQKAPNVLKVACLGIRNIVARNKRLCSAFITLGVEELLNGVDKISCWDEAKAALRDLGCNVKLDEPFKGKGIKLKQ